MKKPAVQELGDSMQAESPAGVMACDGVFGYGNHREDSVRLKQTVSVEDGFGARTGGRSRKHSLNTMRSHWQVSGRDSASHLHFLKAAPFSRRHWEERKGGQSFLLETGRQVTKSETLERNTSESHAQSQGPS